MFSKRSVTRFGKSFFLGIITFSLDLVLLYLFTDLFGWYYLVSAGSAFIIASTLNYILSRKYIFIGTNRPAHHGYFLFLLIGGTGLIFITALMYVFVDLFHLYYILSRILVAFVVGWWNYLMNLYVNFKVAGK